MKWEEQGVPGRDASRNNSKMKTGEGQGREKEAQSTLGPDHYCSVRRLRSLSCVQSGPIAEKENRICARASNHINVYLQRIYRLLLVTGF